MKIEFSMSDLGPLSFYLGIEVQQSKGVITLSQGAYAARIVEKAGLSGCNPCATPMEPKIKLSKDSTTRSGESEIFSEYKTRSCIISWLC
jgi:hypothetical protein